MIHKAAAWALHRRACGLCVIKGCGPFDINGVVGVSCTTESCASGEAISYLTNADLGC